MAFDGRVVLVEYDPRWPAFFEREAARIRKALSRRALRIEHAGSTSVPGLLAKPVIDIVLEVADSADEAAYRADLEAAGYIFRFREQEWHQHRLFNAPEIDVNLHVFSRGCSEIDRMLAFRDRLRTDRADRELYALAKRDLTQRRWERVQEYADAKSSVVEEILARASTPQCDI